MGRIIVSQLRICLPAEYDSVVAPFTDKDAAEENTILKGPQSRRTAVLRCTSTRELGIGSRTDVIATDGCGGWAIFVSSPSVRVQVSHIKPELVPHPASVRRLR